LLMLERYDLISASQYITIFVVFLGMMMASYGSALPTGIFVPSIIIGCGLGGFYAKWIEWMYNGVEGVTLLPHQQGGYFGLMGAVAVLAGINQSSLSLVVILIEGTGEIRFFFPIVLVTIIAKSVSSLFVLGVYETGLELKKIPFLEEESRKWMHGLLVKDIMGSPKKVRCLHTHERVSTLLTILAECSHSGFPVVKGGSSSSKKVCGLVLRSQLLFILKDRRGDFASRTSWEQQEAMRQPALQRVTLNTRGSFICTGADDTSQQSHALQDLVVENGRDRSTTAIDRFTAGLHPQQLDEFVDLSEVMNICPTLVAPGCPVARAWRIFQAVGLRHLVVADDDSCVVGMVTRHDLMDAHHHYGHQKHPKPTWEALQQYVKLSICEDNAEEVAQPVQTTGQQ